MKIFYAFLSCFIFLSVFASPTHAQHTGGYEGGYENGYTGAYTGAYTGGYQGAYQAGYTGSYSQPPGPFGQNAPVASCAGPNQPRIDLNWTQSWGATGYRVYYLDSSVGTMQPAWQTGYNTGLNRSYTFDSSSSLIVGNYYGFMIEAYNAQGYAVSNQPPYSPSYPGGWSQTGFGWIQFPDCRPPGAFNFSVAPTPNCPGVAASAIDMNWGVSARATAYTIYPQSTLRGWIPPAGLPPTTVNGSGGYLRHTIPTPIPANEGWEYTIWATNAYGAASANNSSSYYIFGGWTYAYNCDNPTVDLKIDGTDVIKTVNNGSSIQLNYQLTGVNNAGTYATPSVNGVTTTWTSLYPPNTAVANNWSTSGSRSLTLYNNATYPNASYQFTIQAGNSNLPASANNPVSKTVTVNVLPDKAPYIQTTQGDVHSNSNINVPQ